MATPSNAPTAAATGREVKIVRPYLRQHAAQATGCNVHVKDPSPGHSRIAALGILGALGILSGEGSS